MKTLLLVYIMLEKPMCFFASSTENWQETTFKRCRRQRKKFNGIVYNILSAVAKSAFKKA